MFFTVYYAEKGDKMLHHCKADIRNPLSLLAHERSRFATCQWELLTPTDISIPLTHRLVLYALEAGKCLFCVQGKIDIGSGNDGIISQLKMQNEMKLTDESWISYQQGKGNARKR